MIYLWEIREAIATLRRAGFEPESFSCTAETKAELENASIAVSTIVKGELEKAIGPVPMTLAGIPLRIRP